MSKFISKLSVDLIDDTEDVWRLSEPLRFMSDVVNMTITIPTGFTTDFASVPRIPFAFFLTGNVGRYAATVHDFLYTYPLFDRATADLVFLDALEVSGVNWWRRQMMYLAVRLFGNGTYTSTHKSQK